MLFAILVHSMKTSHASLWIFVLSTPWAWVMISSRSSPQWVTNESMRSFPSSSLSIFAAFSKSFGWVRECPGKLPTSALITEMVVFGMRDHFNRISPRYKKLPGILCHSLSDQRCGPVRAERPEKYETFCICHCLDRLLC